MNTKRKIIIYIYTPIIDVTLLLPNDSLIFVLPANQMGDKLRLSIGILGIFFSLLFCVILYFLIPNALFRFVKHFLTFKLIIFYLTFSENDFCL